MATTKFNTNFIAHQRANTIFPAKKKKTADIMLIFDYSY
jgi:hypothetical protein